DGTFNLSPLALAMAAAPSSVALADYDGNGTLDVEGTSQNGNALQVWQNQSYASANPHLSISTPASATVGTPFNVTVTARDSSNSVLSSFTGAVHFASSDKFAGLPANYTFAAGDAGAKTFSVTLKSPGSQTVSASLFGSSGIFAGATVNAVIPSIGFAPKAD